MTQIIHPGTGTGETSWARFGLANSLDHSKGERKLRVDLTALFADKIKDLAGEKIRKKTLDKAHHLSIALQDSEVHECVERAGDGPLKAGWRQIAVKIKEEKVEAEEGEAAVDVAEDLGVKKQYIILNINSLAKRLGVRKEILKQQEEDGTVDTYIQTRLNEIATQQEKMSGLLNEIRESIYQSKPYTFTPENKEFFKKFIEDHVDHNCRYINANKFEKFCAEWLQPETPDSTKIDLLGCYNARHFIKHLSERIWWDSESFEARHDKVALTDENFASLKFDFGWEKIDRNQTKDVLSNKGTPRFAGFKFYHGKALDRAGHSGNEMNRMQLFDWDKDNRYAIAVGDYAYSSRPYCDYKREFLVQLEQGPFPNSGKWILVNIHSLTRLGLDEKKIWEAAAAPSEDRSTLLLKMIEEKRTILNAFNAHFEADFDAVVEEVCKDSGIINGCMWKYLTPFLEDHRLQHPDEEVRGFLRDMEDETRKISFADNDEGVLQFKEWAALWKAKILALKACGSAEAASSKKASTARFSNEGSWAFGRGMPTGVIEALGHRGLMKPSLIMERAKEISGHFLHPGHAGNMM